ncbi:MAG: aldehyde dehydrogenase family protein, partial [Acidiferrobacterales bacterium]
MTKIQKTISPVDGSVYVERPYASEQEIAAVLTRAADAQTKWKLVPLGERSALCARFVDAFVAKTDEIAPELSWQMGRPVSMVPSEVR